MGLFFLFEEIIKNIFFIDMQVERVRQGGVNLWSQEDIRCGQGNSSEISFIGEVGLSWRIVRKRGWFWLDYGIEVIQRVFCFFWLFDVFLYLKEDGYFFSKFVLRVQVFRSLYQFFFWCGVVLELRFLYVGCVFLFRGYLFFWQR